MNWTLVVEWSFFVLFILVLAYTAIVIGNEKTSYLDEAQYFLFHKLNLPIPKWWTQIKKEKTLWIFERSDTHYDWYASFELLDFDETPIAQLAINYLTEQKVKLDPPPEAQIEENSSHLFKDKTLASAVSEFIRIEGTATQDEQERIYIDLILFKFENQIYRFKSQSSVLNGSVEGPYFEEAISLIKIKDSLD